MTGYQNPPPGYPPGYYPQPTTPAGPAPGGFVPAAPPVAPAAPPPGYGYPGQPAAPAPAPYGYPPQPFQAAYGPPGAPTHYGPPPGAPAGYPGAPGFGAPAGYPGAPGFGAPPMPPMAPPAPVAPAGPPAYHMPTAEEMQALLAAAAKREADAAARRSSSSERPEDFKFPSPDGGTKWNASHAGKEVSIFVRVLPSRSGPPFISAAKHFFPQTDNPSKYNSGWCQGDRCPVCAEVQGMIGSTNEDIRDKGFRARARGTNLWQIVAWSDNPVVQSALETMQLEAGRLKGPMLWEMPNEVHKQILELFGARGPAVFLDLARGAPFKVTRKRTGKGNTDVEYRVVDMLQQAGPLPYGIGPNGEGLTLLDLGHWCRPMKDEKAAELLAELQKYARNVMAQSGGAAAPQTHAYSAAPPAAPTPSPWGQAPQAPAPVAPAGPPALPFVGAPPPTWGQPPPAAPAPQYAQPPPTWGQAPQAEAAPPPALPAGDAHAAAGFPGPRTAPPVDPWGPQAAEPPAWTPPPPPPPTWGQAPQGAPAPTTAALPPDLQALQAQMTGAAPIPAPQGAPGMGPAFPAPPVGAPPPR